MTQPNPHPNAHPGAGAYTNALSVAANLRARGDRASRKAAQVVREYTLLLETQVKGNASGRPGPRARTGDYRRTINSAFQTERGQYTGTVGSNAPQARRLEYGFVGQDRAGRTYNQPPFPHYGPALAQIGPRFRAALARIGTTP